MKFKITSEIEIHDDELIEIVNTFIEYNEPNLSVQQIIDLNQVSDEYLINAIQASEYVIDEIQDFGLEEINLEIIK